MIRIFFWLLLVANLALFAWLRWGGSLTQGGPTLLPALHPEQIKLLGFSPPAPASGTLAASGALPSSAPAALSSASAPASAPGAAPAAAQSGACLDWGEFSGTDLARASENLASLKLGSTVTQREVEHSIGYWVYIPPPKKHADVARKLAQLKKLGIKEHFVVQEKGKWQDAISLGIFKTADLAQKFLDHVKAKGLKGAVMGERQTRLKFTVFSFRNPQASTLSKLAEWQTGFTGIEMKAVPCN